MKTAYPIKLVTTLDDLYNFFKPLAETNTVGSASGVMNKEGDFVTVHWQHANDMMMWTIRDGVVVFDIIKGDAP